MRAILSDTTDAGRFINAYAAPEPATGPRGSFALDRDAAGAVELRRAFGRAGGAALARIERAIVCALNGLRAARDRRQTVREASPPEPGASRRYRNGTARDRADGRCAARRASVPDRNADQPLTAPAVIPAIICRAAKKVKTRGGIAMRVPMAMIRPHSTPVSVMKPAAPTGRRSPRRRSPPPRSPSGSACRSRRGARSRRGGSRRCRRRSGPRGRSSG